MTTFDRTRQRSLTTQQMFPVGINNSQVQTNSVWQWVPSGSSWRYAIVGWKDGPPTEIDLPKLVKASAISDCKLGGTKAIKPVSHTITECDAYPRIRFVLRNQLATEAQDGSASSPMKYYPGYWLTSARIHSELVGWSYQQGFHNLGTRAWVPPPDLSPPSRKGELPAQIVKRIEGLNACQQFIEMKDMPQLANMWRTRGSVGELARSINSLLKDERLGTKNLKRFLGALRSSYLGKVFGIDPTVSLVRDICRLAVDGIPQRKKTFVVTLQSERHSVLHRVTGTTAANVAYLNASCVQQSSVRRVDGARVTDVRPRIGQYSDRFLAISDALIGVNGGRMLWDVAPLGFVFDWFLSIDDLLDTLWANSTHHFMIEYWSSTKSEIVQSWSGEYISDAAGFYPTPIWEVSSLPPYQQKQSIYNRQQEERPSPLDALRFRMGPKQGFLTLLIALGYVPRRYTR